MRKTKTHLSGHASVLFWFVAGQLDAPWFVLVLLATVAATLYGIDSWNWAGQFGALPKRNRQPEVRKLRLILVGLIVAISVCAVGWYVHREVLEAEFAAERKARQEALDRERAETARERAVDHKVLDRYRRFYENSDAPNKTTLIEMTNGELKTRGTNLYTRIRAMNAHYAEVGRNLRAREDKKEISEVEAARLEREQTAEWGKEFEEKHRTEARMVLLELRNRIAYAARKHIVGLPNINPADKRDGKVSMYDIFPAEFAVGFSDMLAREIEELVKMLPNN